MLEKNYLNGQLSPTAVIYSSSFGNTLQQTNMDDEHKIIYVHHHLDIKINKELKHSLIKSGQEGFNFVKLKATMQLHMTSSVEAGRTIIRISTQYFK